MHQLDERGTYIGQVLSINVILSPISQWAIVYQLWCYYFAGVKNLLSSEQLSKTGVLIFAIADTVAATQTEFSNRTRKFYV